MADQEFVAPYVGVISVHTLEAADCAELIRTDRPRETRHEEVSRTSTCLRRVKQILSAAVAVVAYAQGSACYVLRVLLSVVRRVRTEPSPHLESQAADPLVLHL